jgi:hypothetical protein
MIIEKQKFRAWLSWQDKSTVVGIAGSPKRCPLKRYIQTLSERDVKVTHEGEVELSLKYASHSETETQMLPDWAFSFMIQMDTMDGPGQITAQGALDILESMPSNLES